MSAVIQKYREVGFVPVIAGADTGAYALARAFHEAYGIPSFSLGKAELWMIRHSEIVRYLPVASATDPDELLKGLETAELDQLRETGVKLLLLGSMDATVQAIIQLRDAGRLPLGFVAPYVDQQRFEAGTIKHNFSALAQRLGINHPVTRIVDLAQPLDTQLPLNISFPVWAKPSDVSAWLHISFEGRKKVHRMQTPEELQQLLSAAEEAGYRGSFVVQEEIPGDDQQMRVLTCYCDADSRIRFASYGETIVEDHSPALLGNPSVILTGQNSQAVEQAQQLVSELKWVGYANFDLKYDPRDGSTKFFELNPRLGNSSYYVTGTGHNPVTWYVADWILNTLPPAAGQPPLETTEETVYTLLPKWLAPRYVTDPQRRRRVAKLLRSGGARNPFFYAADRSLRRRPLVLAAQAKLVKKFFTYYPPHRSP
ncbi:carboxylate--amine ligase [Nesterenkonia ebinurensis]|uniref:carboxylate--amine ligase n=1 Tax=Nesterenkonia ebinurensis TaxID=2608252 RepID=UPI00123D50F1|nr:hypothetical protein [Nesterenkonia ebinurensis]